MPFLQFECIASDTYRQVFAQMMLAQDLAYHLIIRHQNNHFVAPRFPTLTNNPRHIKLVLLLILQRCNFIIIIFVLIYFL
jgi:hypothetical protein